MLFKWLLPVLLFVSSAALAGDKKNGM